MCYCAKIKEMMELSKERNEAVVSEFSEGTIYVKYYEQFDDYTLQYSWIIDEEDSKVRNEVQNVLSKYLQIESRDNQNLDIIQVGLVCVYNTNADQLCNIIELCKTNKLKYTRDTKYVFCGKKVLRVIQYYGSYSNPFDCVGIISKWNDSAINDKIENQSFSKIIRNIYYYYNKEVDSIIFSIGSKFKKTIFENDISKNVPSFLYIDSIQGIMEYNLID